LAGLALAQEKAPKEEPAGISKPVNEKSTEAAKSEEAKGKRRAILLAKMKRAFRLRRDESRILLSHPPDKDSKNSLPKA